MERARAEAEAQRSLQQEQPQQQVQQLQAWLEEERDRGEIAREELDLRKDSEQELLVK